LSILSCDERDIFKLLYLIFMCSYRNRDTAFSWIRPASFGLMLLVLFLVSCNEIERHEVLTFFFDGVPPLEQERLAGEPLETTPAQLAQTAEAPVWYVHEARKDCSNCHSKRKQRGFSSDPRLIAPIPQLCYNCHTDFTASAAFVHGPVAVGQCLYCHNPHKSQIKYLLSRPEPELCYQCHDINTIELIPAHLPKQLSACTDCHDPHASSNKALLKGNSLQTSGELKQPAKPEAAEQNRIPIANGQDKQSGAQQRATTSETSTRSKSLSEVFRETSRLIELGELEQARAYLDKFKDDNAFTAEERGQIVRVLGMIDSVINRGEQKSESDRQKTEMSELYYSSMAFYRTGQLTKAREGFVKILKSGSVPEAMAKTIRGYISDIDNKLAGNERSKKLR
jgi:predicted CXXCH cytochrome family protein